MMDLTVEVSWSSVPQFSSFPSYLYAALAFVRNVWSARIMLQDGAMTLVQFNSKSVMVQVIELSKEACCGSYTQASLYFT